LDSNTIRPAGGLVAATNRPWYRRVFNPMIVVEAYPPMPLVSSHSRVREADRSLHVRWSKAITGFHSPLIACYDSKQENRMRYWVAALLVMLWSRVGMAQNPFEPETNIGCVERLQMPTYPPLARQAQVEATITASVLLSPKPTVQQQVTTQFKSKTQRSAAILMPTVEKAIQEAAFRSDCTGKTVVLIFDFKVTGPPSGNPKQSVSFGYPNKFWIVTEPSSAKLIGQID
jgi:hypothetical protein